MSEIEKAGQNIREAYQRRLPVDPAKDYYFMQRETVPLQTITVEYGFLDSSYDDVYQLKNFSNEYAEAVVKAILEYLKVPYIPPLSTDIYVVKSGDSLWSIAKKFNISVDELKQMNDLSSNLLSIGQILKIRRLEEEIPSVEYIIYTVKAGDSLYAIGRSYNISVEELKTYNSLTSNVLSIGQKIKIPTLTTLPILPFEEDFQIYIVRQGDTLYSIARKYDLTVDKLKEINNLSSNVLSLNQQIKIPIGIKKETLEYIEYVVKSGDNLYSISTKYNTTVDKIKEASNIISNNLSIGQILRIPKMDIITYTVKKGDNLYSIANKYNTTVDNIKRKNNLKSNNLSIGQILII